jgi:PiT family inorganic phosphate transporter
MDMVKMERYEAFSADFAGATCVLIATLTGLPISTTHAKTAAIMGTGASKRLTNVNWGLSKRLIYSWFIVFPFCGAIGYALTWLALRIF